jgi:hypothetical protein
LKLWLLLQPGRQPPLPKKHPKNKKLKMKTLTKLILATGALLAMLAPSAQAQVTAPVTIHINGSTAYRAAVHEAIVQILTSPTAAFLSGKTLATSNQAVFQGTINGQTVVFETDWTGSISGIINTANATAPSGSTSWLSPSNITGTAATPGTQTISNAGGTFYSNFDLNAGPGGGNASAATPTYDTAAAPDVCLSDAFQSSTPQAALTTLSGFTGSTAGNAGSINDSENGEIVGVIPFVWLKNAALTNDTNYTTWKNITNITNLQAKELLTTYQQPASFLTGIATDTCPIYITGRDGDTGTRFSELAETGFGVTTLTHQITFNTALLGTAPYQQETGNFTKAQFKLTTASPGANVGGYSSGGTLCGFLADYGTDTDSSLFAGEGYVVGYAGIADADSALAPSGLPVAGNSHYPANYAPAQELAYNGVFESLATISNGTYQGWEYEHFYTLPSSSNPNASNTSWLTVVGNLVGELENTYVVRPGAPAGTGSSNEVTAHVAGYLVNEVAPTSKNAEGGVISP